jgi:hypothetical protein
MSKKFNRIIEKFLLKIFFFILLLGLISGAEAQRLYNSQQTPNKSFYNKTVTQYNVIVDSIYFYNIINEKDSVLSSKSVFIFDGSGNVTSKISLTFDADQKIWINRDREEYTYDKNGNNTLYVLSSWKRSESKWNGIRKFEYIYNDLNQPIIFKESMSYLFDGNFTPYDSTFSFFSIVGKDSISSLYFWDVNANKWEIGSKFQYNYDKNNNQIQLLEYFWEESKKEWIEASKNETFFDSFNRDTLAITSKFDEIDNQWIPSFQYVTIFEEFSSTQICSVWNTSLKQLINSGKKESFFDENGNIIISKSYKVSDTTNDWIENYREENIYDDGMLKYQNIYDWDYQFNTLVFKGKFIYFSHLKDADLDHTTTSLHHPLIFPNPVTDKIFINNTSGINISKMKIFNSSGRLLYEYNIKEGKNICEVSKLSVGYYFIQLITQNNTLCYKILKE